MMITSTNYWATAQLLLIWDVSTLMSRHCNLTHWGRVTHICVGHLSNSGSDNGLWPGRRQAIIWTTDGILRILPLGTNFSEISIEFLTFWFKKRRLNVWSAKWQPFCLGLNVLTHSKKQVTTSLLVTWTKAFCLWIYTQEQIFLESTSQV